VFRILLALCFVVTVAAQSTSEGAESDSIAWCNGDSECLLKSKKLIPLFAKERGMTEAAVRETLNNCEGLPASNLGFCGWYSQFEAEVELKDQIQRLARNSTKTCAGEILASQRRWEREVERKCDEQANKETNGLWSEHRGAYGHEVKAGCLMAFNDQRSKTLKTVSTCSPCGKCL
jgi:Lysozyme inhibitor LprI